MEDILVDRKRALIAGVGGGLVHFAIVGGISVYLYGLSVFGYSPATNAFHLFDLPQLSVIFGSFILGAIPAVLLVERRLVTPSVVIGTIVASILLVEPGALERTLNPQLPTLLEFYFLFWFAPLFVACVAGGVEYFARRLLRDESDENGRNTRGEGSNG